MKLYQPYFFSELGKRTNQEDSFYPINPSDNDNLFIVCDGMGDMNMVKLLVRWCVKALLHFSEM